MKKQIKIDAQASSIGLKSLMGDTITISDITDGGTFKNDDKEVALLKLMTSDGKAITCGHGAIARSIMNDGNKLPIKDGELTIDFPITGKVDFNWNADKSFQLYYLNFDESPAKFAV